MADSKIITISEAAAISARACLRGDSVVTTNGCFDILHVGHVQNLEWAAAQGDVFIVGVNSDASVRANKGPRRPIVPARERARVIAGLACVDHVFVFDGKSPIPWLRKVKPAVHVKGKGSEKSPAFKSEEDAVKQSGGRVVLAPLVRGRSTTDIIERIVKKYGQ